MESAKLFEFVLALPRQFGYIGVHGLLNSYILTGGHIV